MVAFLLDTCVFAEIQRPQGNANVRARAEQIARDQSFVSVITIGELTKGVALLPTGKRQRAFALSLLEIEQQYAAQILPIDIEIARLWGELSARAQASGIQVAAPDGLIAATALHHGLTVMTRNSRHFAFSGVMVIDPWQE
jgi:predicted nucleic acid-binding protein